MKLTEKYQAAKLPENSIYSALQCVFHEVFCDVPNIDIASSSLLEKRFVYNETEEERKFYNEKYFNLTSTHTNKNDNGSSNKYENDLIDYSTHLEKKMLILAGNQGWGKTTLLRKVFFQILPNQKSNILPIYISFNRHINNFSSTREYFEESFYSLLSNHARKYTVDVLGSLDNDFLLFLKQKPEHINFDIALRQIENLPWAPQMEDQRLNEIRILQQQESQKSSTALYSLQFIQSKYQVKPIFIFDDLDALPYNFIIWLFNEAYKISQVYDFKTILAMRPITYRQIEKYGTLRVIDPVNIKMESPDCNVFLSETLKNFEKKIKTLNKRAEIIVGNKKITPEDINIFIRNYCKILASHDAKLFLKHISGGDLRRLRNLIRTYFCSGHIEPERIISDILTLNPKESSLPTWIVYTSIITNNYLSVFPHTKTNEDEFVVNLFCNGKEYSNTYLIRLHILAYFCKHKRISDIEEFLDQYKPLLPNIGLPALKNSIKKVLKRFNNAGLITNNKYLYIDRRESINDIEEFLFQPLAGFYMLDLFTKFEYIVYMKDDVDYDIDCEIRDCIEIREQQERFREVVKFLYFFFEKEKIFFQNIPKTHINNYINYFSPENTEYILFSHQIVDKLIDYGQRRNFDVYELEKLKKEIINLLSYIDKTN